MAAKDQLHANAVEESGGEFYPIVVESFGVWAPCSAVADPGGGGGAKGQRGHAPPFRRASIFFISMLSSAQSCAHV